ncbi:MAG: RpiB/LacA/LacB family sugar-phosphate isomerase [bacterium]
MELLNMNIYIGSDHAGYSLKNKLKAYLEDFGYLVEDKGAYSLDEKDDYPDFIIPVAEAVAQDKESMGIILGGSGEGEEMAANKVHGIRACEYYGGNLEIVRLARMHNDANVLSLGARFVSEDEAKEAVRIFIETPFSGDERHVRRIDKVEQEEENI